MTTDNEILEKIKLIEQTLPAVNFGDGIPKPNWEASDALEHKMEKYNVPGLSISFINNFEIEWIKNYGIKDKNSKEKITNKTLFEAGSTTKTLTAIAALSLVEKNLVQLDEPVNNFLKKWKIPDNEYTAEKSVTLRQLLTHTSGMNRPDSMFGTKEGETATILQVLNGESPALNDPVKIEKIPGTEHHYSNIAFIVIEKLIQDILEEETSEIIEKLIFKPLNMKNSRSNYPLDTSNISIILHHDEKGNVKESGSINGVFGCGGLITTAEDLSKFLIELMKTYQGDSMKIVSQKMLKEMLKTQLVLDPKKSFGWTGQGLGVFIFEKGDNLFFLHPGTNSPGAVCMMIGNPRTGQGLVIMSNGIMGELLHIEILMAVSRTYNWSVYR